jgi:hypothetical protein
MTELKTKRIDYGVSSFKWKKPIRESFREKSGWEAIPIGEANLSDLNRTYGYGHDPNVHMNDIYIMGNLRTLTFIRHTEQISSNSAGDERVEYWEYYAYQVAGDPATELLYIIRIRNA